MDDAALDEKPRKILMHDIVMDLTPQGWGEITSKPAVLGKLVERLAAAHDRIAEIRITRRSLVLLVHTVAGGDSADALETRLNAIVAEEARACF